MLVQIYIASFLFYISILVFTLAILIRPEFIFNFRRKRKASPAEQKTPKWIKIISLLMLFITSLWLGFLSWNIGFFNSIIIL